MDRMGDGLSDAGAIETASDWIVTGAGGYLGARVLSRCHASGRRAVGLTRTDADLREPSAVARAVPMAATILHCAAPVPKTQAGYSDDAAAADGVAMVRALLERSPAHLVFASSMTVYGTVSSPVSEEDAPPPGGGYAGGKRRAELDLLASGLPTTILRLPGLFGSPRRGGFLYNAIRARLAGRPFTTPDEPPVWAALHVDDAAWAMVRSAECGPNGPHVLNVGYHHRFSLPAALAEIETRLNLPISEQGPAPEFEMLLDRLEDRLGALPGTWESRLDQLIEWARDEGNDR